MGHTPGPLLHSEALEVKELASLALSHQNDIISTVEDRPSAPGKSLKLEPGQSLGLGPRLWLGPGQ